MTGKTGRVTWVHKVNFKCRLTADAGINKKHIIVIIQDQGVFYTKQIMPAVVDWLARKGRLQTFDEQGAHGIVTTAIVAQGDDP